MLAIITEMSKRGGKVKSGMCIHALHLSFPSHPGVVHRLSLTALEYKSSGCGENIHIKSYCHLKSGYQGDDTKFVKYEFNFEKSNLLNVSLHSVTLRRPNFFSEQT